MATDYSPRNAAPRQFVLFAYGFRPFFLLAALDAVANMAIWLTVFLNPQVWPDRAIPAMYWHAHEMLFGFVAAAISGFLLTAVPGWTGRKSYGGGPLYFLTALWLAGRIAMAPLPPFMA
ncbi:MAG: NnrS family protein, partial [Proteobacteria bacterium]|nr:NnrS family protein [Pseudomonadota bacterium]